MPQRKNGSSKDEPGHFFVKELADETPPSRQTMELLCDLAAQLFLRRPWDLLNESELILVKDPLSGEMCHCSVMGELGEVLALHAYIGAESLRLFRRLEAGEPTTMGEFLVSQHSVSVEFVKRARLEAPDRELFSRLGLPLKKGALAPVFRVIRPGYYPWYVTEAEAQTLAECQRATIALCDQLSAHADAHYWDEEGVYPLLSRAGEEGSRQEFRVERAEVKEPPLPAPDLPALDEARIGRIRERKYPRDAALEVDSFYAGGMIGGKDERKACTRLALAIDAKTGIAYPPEVSLHSMSIGDALASVVLRAIDAGRVLPREICVGNAAYKLVLDPLANALGFSVRVKKSLPALEFAKEHLLQVMRDPGPLPFV